MNLLLQGFIILRFLVTDFNTTGVKNIVCHAGDFVIQTKVL